MWLYWGLIILNMAGVVMNVIATRRLKVARVEFEDACRVMFDLEQQANMLLRELEQD